MRGKKTPTKIKEFQGTLEMSRVLENELQPPELLSVEPPEMLETELEQKIWHQQIKPLIVLGVVTQVDLFMVAVYCMEAAQWLELKAAIRKHEGIVNQVTETGINGTSKQRPEIQIMQQSFKTIKSIAVEYGISAIQRSKIEVKPTEEKDDDWD